MSKIGSGLSLGIYRFELGLGTGELDLASEGLVELSQLAEIVTDGPEALRFVDSASDLDQLFAFSKDDFLGFVVEKADEGLSPWFVDREVEFEFLLRGTVGVSEDGDVCLEDPGG